VSRVLLDNAWDDMHPIADDVKMYDVHINVLHTIPDKRSEQLSLMKSAINITERNFKCRKR